MPTNPTEGLTDEQIELHICGYCDHVDRECISKPGGGCICRNCGTDVGRARTFVPAATIDRREREAAERLLVEIDDEIAAADFGEMPVNSPAGVAHSTLVNLRQRLAAALSGQDNQEGNPT